MQKVNKNNNFNSKEISNIIYEILDDFKLPIKITDVSDCNNTIEVLDCILDPYQIMYEKIKISKELFNRQNISILAFKKSDNQPVKLFSTITGYKYKNKQSKKICSININDFNTYVYLIHKPLPYKKKLINSLLLYILENFSLKDILFILFSTLIITLLSSVVPSINKLVLDKISIPDNHIFQFLILTFIIYIFAGIAKSIFSVVKKFFLSDITRKLSLFVQSGVISKILLQNDDSYNIFSIGRVYEKIKNARSFAQIVVSELFDTIVVTFFSIIYIFQITTFDKKFVLPFCLMLIIWIIVSIALSYKNIKYESALLKEKVETNALSYQTFKGMEKIKNSGLENIFIDKMIKKYFNYIDLLLDPPKTKLFFGTIINFMLSLISVVILTITITNKITVVNYIAFSASFGLIAGSIQQLITSINSFFATKPIISQLEEIIDLNNDSDKNNKFFKGLNEKIELVDVNCTYEHTNKEILKNINLTINKGEKIAIVGESGSGKSTILRVLLGLDKINSGEILFDSIPINKINLRSLRKKCGIVFQFSTIIPGTIKENIIYDSEYANDDDILDIINKVALDDFVNELPLGIYTVINEASASNISGGQMQRLLLAKALYKKPSILILDEATSALDNITQAKIFKTIYGLDVTTILIAHRLSTIKYCDKIIVLKNGSIVEAGTFDELMNNKKEFYNLAINQQY